MRIFFSILSLCSAFFFWTCQNLEDAKPSSRNTFIRKYEAPYDISANDMEASADGFIVVGDMNVPPEGSAVDSIVTVVFKVDNNGKLIGDFNYFIGASGKSIVRFPTGGYIIAGDSIKKNLDPPNVANGLVSSVRLLVLNEDLDSLYSDKITVVRPDSIPKMDFYSGAITLSETGEIVMLGTYIEATPTQIGVPEKPFLVNYSWTGSTLVENWRQDYPLITRNYKNARSVYAYNNTVIWASGIAQTLGDVTVSYVNIPYVADNSVFLNSSTIGENSNQLFLPKDIHPSKSVAFGYGVVGTYSEPLATDGSKANMFFLRVDAAGTIDESSVLFFDAKLGVLEDSTLSATIDEGQAITSTYDGGFVIAGTMETIPGTGNGGKDIFLVKIDAFNNTQWSKIIGGVGDEVVCSIKETADKNLVICGTNTLGNASSIFIIKTDRNGELKK